MLKYEPSHLSPNTDDQLPCLVIDHLDLNSLSNLNFLNKVD